MITTVKNVLNWTLVVLMIALLVGIVLGLVFAVGEGASCSYESTAECLADEGDPGYEHPRGS